MRERHWSRVAQGDAAEAHGEVERRRPAGQRSDVDVVPQERFQVLFKASDIGAQGRDPVLVEGFLDIALFFPAHMGRRKP